jgi:ketosteroid isomerase-like protein
MTSPTLPATMGAEYLRLLDAKDEVAIHHLLAEDAQLVDELTRTWVRGRDAIGGVLRDLFSRVCDVHSTADDVHVERWGDVEVETFVLRQVYDLADAPCWAVSPTTLVWRRTADGWRLALIDSIPTCS